MIYLLKALLSAAIIVSATEVAKRNSAMAALLLAIPLISIIALFLMWVEGQSTLKIADVASTTVWYVLPTLPMFLLLSYLLRHGYNFLLSLTVSLVLLIGLFYLTQHLINKFSV